MITHVVFDFDGTLVDSRELAVQLINELAEKGGFSRLTAENLEELRNLSIIERCSRLGIPTYKLPWMAIQLARSYRKGVPSLLFNEGIPELLKELRARGLKLLILSSNSEENIRAFLKRHSAEDWVEDIYSGGGAFGKASKLRTLLKRTGLRREQIVYVGDEQRDVEACKQVGVKVIAVLWGVDA
ncbi:MAG TPA: HAD-IA family hydrolase, partial [Archangium sp.]|nr:HAD-IA family hydrolase [Archangium sp.]